MKPLPFLRCNGLRCFALLILLIAMALPARSHEINPTVADFSADGGALSIDFRMNAEAFLAGIDLDGLGNTNDAHEGAVYDDLRMLSSPELEARFRAFLETWIDTFKVDVGGPVALSLVSLSVDPPGDPRVARNSYFILTGQIPPLARYMVLDWPEGAGDLILRQTGVSDPYAGYIQGGQSTPAIPLDGEVAQSAWSVFASYIPVGFAHIVPMGLDHILFVLGLFFLGTAWRSLLWQVSAFTLAHTVTLALGALGWVRVPGSVVEPLIAASIVYVAVENIWLGHLTRWRPMVIFCFGLLHGLGFASVLGEYGLPRAHFFPALFGFNIGVEFGQLTVIAAAFLAVGYWFGDKPWYRNRIAIPASAVIAVVGAYWFVERVFL